jgi:hypothetical protein
VIINAVGCNFELNGHGDLAVFDAMHDVIAAQEPHILCRMEVSDGEAKAERWRTELTPGSACAST